MNAADLLRQFQVQALGTISLAQFGALCDGATDDLAALQAASGYIGAQGMTLVVPGNTYVSAAIALPDNIRVRFEGPAQFVGPGVVSFSPWTDGQATGGGSFVVPVYSLATRPAAVAGQRGGLIILSDPAYQDGADVVQICIRTSAGGYVWQDAILAGL